MQNRVMSGRPRATVLPLFFLMLVVAALPANAKDIAVGSAWIHRDAPAATEVQLLDDLLCSVEFQEQCFGGMMAPDSLLCVLETLPDQEWPEDCAIALECRVTDPDGNQMFDGMGMMGDMMRREVIATVHYSPDTVNRMGMEPMSMRLAIWDGTGYAVCEDAVHDVDAATFTLLTKTPNATYAVISNNSTVEARSISWSELKARN